MLEIGGLIHDKTPSGKDLVVHTGSYLNSWIAVRSVGNRFEIYPVAIDALGRRRALEVAAGYIQEICTLCPFQDLCDPKPYPYYSLGMKEKDRFPAVQVNF